MSQDRWDHGGWENKGMSSSHGRGRGRGRNSDNSSRKKIGRKPDDFTGNTSERKSDQCAKVTFQYEGNMYSDIEIATNRPTNVVSQRRGKNMRSCDRKPVKPDTQLYVPKQRRTQEESQTIGDTTYLPPTPPKEVKEKIGSPTKRNNLTRSRKPRPSAEVYVPRAKRLQIEREADTKTSHNVSTWEEEQMLYDTGEISEICGNSDETSFELCEEKFVQYPESVGKKQHKKHKPKERTSKHSELNMQESNCFNELENSRSKGKPKFKSETKIKNDIWVDENHVDDVYLDGTHLNDSVTECQEQNTVKDIEKIEFANGSNNTNDPDNVVEVVDSNESPAVSSDNVNSSDEVIKEVGDMVKNSYTDNYSSDVCNDGAKILHMGIKSDVEMQVNINGSPTQVTSLDLKENSNSQDDGQISSVKKLNFSITSPETNRSQVSKSSCMESCDELKGQSNSIENELVHQKVSASDNTCISLSDEESISNSSKTNENIENKRYPADETIQETLSDSEESCRTENLLTMDIPEDNPNLPNSFANKSRIDQSLIQEETKNIENATLDDLEEGETWDQLFDDDGEALDPALLDELTLAVGKVKVEKTQFDYYDYKLKDPVLDDDAYSHLIEIYDFPKELVTRDLVMAFNEFKDKGFEIKWVDDTHAIGVFSSTIAANSALGLAHPLMKVCPMSQASRQTKIKAKKCNEFLQPYKPRPDTVASVARNMVAGALGLQTNVPKEKREEERRKLKEAKELKKAMRKQKQQAWDGSYGGKCAMDDY